VGGGQDRGRVHPDQPVGALGDRDRPLGGVAQGEAGDPEHGGLLLEPARVGEDQPGPGLEPEEGEVALGLDQPDAGQVEAERVDPGPGARVDREQQGQLAGHAGERGQHRPQSLRMVNEGRAVQGDQPVLGGRVQALQHVGGERLVQVGQQRVHHHVADPEHPPGLDALGGQVVVGVRRRGEQPVRQRVGEDAVDLLRHAPVARAQPGLQVGDGDLQLGRDQRAGDRGVHVADHHHRVAPAPGQPGLEPEHHGRGLLGVGAGPDAEVDVRGGDPEVGEEPVGHALVVVLAGVDQAGLQPDRVQGAQHRGDLHEVRPGARDDGESHRRPRSRPSSSATSSPRKRVLPIR
jgi:hypothetical protein